MEIWVSCLEEGPCLRKIERCRKCKYHAGEVGNKVQCKYEWKNEKLKNEECFIGC